MFSKLVRRTHIYLALFLAPWMIGYAVSTVAMQHRMPRPTTFVTERDQDYPNQFEPGTPPREIAQLADSLSGEHSLLPPRLGPDRVRHESNARAFLGLAVQAIRRTQIGFALIMGATARVGWRAPAD